ncbi:SRPBCC family protein [Thiocystis violascens]|uniref:Polyketide cyclase / dehydrase and lipid transport n=1 Tax=Thiocystis violascens (strain ATCC 17096 / DSM 198 / 6111) TaxID=765911 RepID=I3YC70_THIV6|nr:SRPBCC family protein [Thiocystis violascens]AFL74588.1 Polyketide cyclase / dehydrase and lipid transport [Thiocystis violascens DSM 198]
MIKTESEALIECPREEVFRFVAEDFVLNYPRWSPEVRALEAVTDGPFQVDWIGRQVRFDHGRWSDSQFCVTVFEPSRQLTLDGITDTYRIDYRFEPVETCTRVFFALELEIAPTLRLFANSVRKAVQNTGNRTMSNLKWLIEEEFAPRARGISDGR